MRLIFGAILVVGVGLAFFAANLVKGHLARQEVALAQTREVASQRLVAIEVVALKEPVAYGDPLTPDKVGVIRYAEDFLPEGAFMTMEELFPQGEEVPRIVLRPMEQLEPVLAVKVSEPGASGGLVTRLDKGMRAFAIRTDVSSGVSGFLHPGDRVDVYWTGRAPGAAQDSDVTRLIRSAVQIMAVDQTDDTSRSGAMVARTVTVKASAQDVAALAQAQATGRLSLALVGATDEAVAEVVEVDQHGLLGIKQEERQLAEAPKERVCTIRNRRGAEVVETPVPCSN